MKNEYFFCVVADVATAQRSAISSSGAGDSAELAAGAAILEKADEDPSEGRGEAASLSTSNNVLERLLLGDSAGGFAAAFTFRLFDRPNGTVMGGMSALAVLLAEVCSEDMSDDAMAEMTGAEGAEAASVASRMKSTAAGMGSESDVVDDGCPPALTLLPIISEGLMVSRSASCGTGVTLCSSKRTE